MEASIISIAADEDAKFAGVEASWLSILQWLGRREDNWLMIFDGANVGYEVVEGFIPPGKHGNILISSCNTTMNRLSSPPSAYMEVVQLDEDAAVELFVKSAHLSDPSPAEGGHIKKIVQELCCLALAVEQAASSIATGVCHIDEYLDMYRQHYPLTGSSNYQCAEYMTWDISFTELEHRASSSPDSASYEAAILLLQLFSFLHFNGIQEETFCHAAEVTGDNACPLAANSPSTLSYLLERSESNIWDPFNFHSAVNILTQFSLIHVDHGSTFSMHCLVHQWMQARLPESSRSKIALLAATILAQSVDYRGSAEDQAHHQALLVHLIPLSTHLRQAGLIDQLSVDVLKRMAYIYDAGGKLSEAEVLLQRAICLLQKDNLEDTEQYINLLSQLAVVIWGSGRLREAVALEQQVLEWREKNLGINHILTAEARNSLAVTLHDLGELKQAKELKLQVLDWQKEYLGMDHPDTYQVMAHLAGILRDLGELWEAKQLEIQVLNWRKEHFGMDHSDTYMAMDNLACTWHNLGELLEAKDLVIQVLEWRKLHLGKDHPDIYQAMGHLAGIFCDLGELVKAKDLEMQVMEWQKVHLGMNHPATYTVMDNLALTLHNLGEFVEAKELKIQVLLWQKQKLGVDHPDTYQAMAHLAGIFCDLGEFREAKQLVIQVLEWGGKHFEMENPTTISAMEILAYTLRKLGEFIGAEELFAQVKELRRTIHSPISTWRTSLDRTGAGAASDDKFPCSPVCLKPTFPAQWSYVQNQHFNSSSGSLVATILPSSSSSRTEHQKVLREAASMLCQEVKKPPAHISCADWEKVSTQMQNPVRLEQLWNRAGFPSTSTEPSSSEQASLGPGGEESDNQVFAEALKDGYVLCQ
jgi:tetratricopeptide (TPR) repeat protein